MKMRPTLSYTRWATIFRLTTFSNFKNSYLPINFYWYLLLISSRSIYIILLVPMILWIVFTIMAKFLGAKTFTFITLILTFMFLYITRMNLIMLFLISIYLEFTDKFSLWRFKKNIIKYLKFIFPYTINNPEICLTNSLLITFLLALMFSVTYMII